MPGAAKTSVAELVSQAITDSPEPTTEVSKQAPGNDSVVEEKLPGYLPENIRQRLAGLPADQRQQELEWYKSVYSDYQRKTDGISRERTQLEDLKGRMEETLREAMTKQATVSQAKSDTRSFFDELMDQTSDATAREQLSKLRRGILQETNAEGIAKELAEVKAQLKQFMMNTQVSRRDTLLDSLHHLSPSYEPLVEKYRQQVIEMGVQYPNLSAKKLLQLIATEEEYDQAVQADGVKQVKKELQRTKDASVPKLASGTSAVGVTEKDKIAPKGNKAWYGSRWNLKSIVERTVPEVRSGSS